MSDEDVMMEKCVTLSLISGRSRVVTVLSVISILATISLKVSLLVWSVGAANSVYVTMSPPQYGESCTDDTLSIITHESYIRYYAKLNKEECKDITGRALR